MSNQSVNPLAKHFRQPQIYIKLPSNGKWYSRDSLEPTATGEYAVYPMTARDELTFKTPDALLNGQSTVDVIQSCVPNIKNAWHMPTIDLDAVLIAIRQATYGNDMEFTSICPHCNEQLTSSIDLSYATASIESADYSQTMQLDDLTFYFKPIDYQQFNENSKENFEQQRLMAVINDDSLTEEDKTEKFKTLFKRLLTLNIQQLSKTISAIKSGSDTVSDPIQIEEFFENCDRKTWDKVKVHIEKLNEQNKIKELNLTCENEPCGKSYTTPLLFEMSSFFA